MARKTELDEPTIFYIPDNFIVKGTLLGGMLKTRNTIEALIIVLGLGYPICLIPMNLTVKIVILSIVCLPLGVWALIGMNNGPLSQFILDFIKFKKFPHEYEYDARHLDKNPRAAEIQAEKSKQEKANKQKTKKQKKGEVLNEQQ